MWVMFSWLKTPHLAKKIFRSLRWLIFFAAHIDNNFLWSRLLQTMLAMQQETMIRS